MKTGPPRCLYRFTGWVVHAQKGENRFRKTCVDKWAGTLGGQAYGHQDSRKAKRG